VLTLSANATNILGSQSTLNVVIRDDESNQAPTAAAGNDSQVNTRQNVTLAGSGSDPENQQFSYLWQQITGTNVTINNADSPQASFTAPSTAGILEFSLTITDDFDLTNADNVSVTVIAAVQPTPTSSGGGSLHFWFLIGLLSLGLTRNKTSIKPHMLQKY
jgi:hypothetical protein